VSFYGSRDENYKDYFSAGHFGNFAVKGAEVIIGKTPHLGCDKTNTDGGGETRYGGNTTEVKRRKK